VISLGGLRPEAIPYRVRLGTVFWLMRALLALVPPLALRFPIKK
jgi:hypothetical protein